MIVHLSAELLHTQDTVIREDQTERKISYIEWYPDKVKVYYIGVEEPESYKPLEPVSVRA